MKWRPVHSPNDNDTIHNAHDKSTIDTRRARSDVRLSLRPLARRTGSLIPLSPLVRTAEHENAMLVCYVINPAGSSSPVSMQREWSWLVVLHTKSWMQQFRVRWDEVQL